MLVQPPKHLVATLNRFQYDSSTQRRTKLLSSVSFPRLLWLPVEEASATLPRTTSIAPDERAGSDGDASDGGACSAADEPADPAVVDTVNGNLLPQEKIQQAISTTVLAPDGSDYELGVLDPSTTMLQVKQKLAELSPISVGR